MLASWCGATGGRPHNVATSDGEMRDALTKADTSFDAGSVPLPFLMALAKPHPRTAVLVDELHAGVLQSFPDLIGCLVPAP
jgi:hypothetical protein